MDDQGRGIVVKMAQSYRGSCEGLWSAEEGDRTYTLWKGECYVCQYTIKWVLQSSSSGIKGALYNIVVAYQNILKS
jgi:hypothetical protein